jgi:hypothetical protein
LLHVLGELPREAIGDGEGEGQASSERFAEEASPPSRPRGHHAEADRRRSRVAEEQQECVRQVGGLDERQAEASARSVVERVECPKEQALAVLSGYHRPVVDVGKAGCHLAFELGPRRSVAMASWRDEGRQPAGACGDRQVAAKTGWQVGQGRSRKKKLGKKKKN